MKPIPIANSENKSRLYIPEGTIIAETLLRIIKYKKLREVYSGLQQRDSILLIDAILNELDLKYEIPEEDLKNIPPEGPFITVSNHPYRGIDSMLLLKLIYEKRKDFRIMANYLLQEIEDLQDVIIPINTFETGSNRSSFSGIKEGIIHLRNSGCLGLFPTGEGSEYIEISNTILDNEWLLPAVKFIKNANVPVVPVYFHGTNSRLLHIVRMINPLLKATSLPSEIRNKKKRTVRIRIGTPVPVKEQSEFRNAAQYGRYLRARTYSLGSKLEPERFFNIRSIIKKSDPEPLTDPVPRKLLEEEFNRVRCDCELFSIRNFSVICAPVNAIPQIINEIGRLRELTFRDVGEGTNKSSDIDEYDLYYNHLIIWDTEAKCIVGSYRIGKGKEISATYGLKGFYITSLFRVKKGFIPVLNESLELGRSFIVKEYQKKAMPLFLLWKGIMIFLLRNPEYRYLIGPVSISNEFSKFSKSLIVEFIKAYFFDMEKAKYIVPRKEFVVKNDKVIDRKVFIDVADRDINRIERIVMDIEPGYRIPVLLRKYLELNSKMIGFNVDPKFNDCLDGLMIMDLYNAPPDFYKALSKDLKNDSLIPERFRF